MADIGPISPWRRAYFGAFPYTVLHESHVQEFVADEWPEASASDVEALKERMRSIVTFVNGTNARLMDRIESLEAEVKKLHERTRTLFVRGGPE